MSERRIHELPSLVGATEIKTPAPEVKFTHGDVVRLVGSDQTCPDFVVSHFFTTDDNKLVIVEVAGWNSAHGLVCLKAPQQCFNKKEELAS